MILYLKAECLLGVLRLQIDVVHHLGNPKRISLVWISGVF